MPRQARAAKTVLVIEDDPTISGLIAAVLESEGYYPVLVHNGDEAVHTAHKVRPDAITLDLELPGLDGRSILRRLRDDPQERHVPVVVVSSSSEMLSSQERGAVSRTIAKPFLLPDLVEAVSFAVGTA
jgi:CheY-like chemotaxis protein